MEIGVRARFLFLLACVAWGATAQAPSYRLVTNPEESARESAAQLLRLLAEGNIEAAAALSNAPQQRYEVLRDYRDAVGEEAFKSVYARYFDPANRLVAEAAIGPRRLLIWDLGEASHHLAGQYFVEVDGRFLLDDAPSEERSRLQRVLQDYREEKRR
jgi:hypothetical protein